MKAHVQITLEFILTQTYQNWLLIKQDQCLLESLFCIVAAYQRTWDQWIGVPEHLGMLKILSPWQIKKVSKNVSISLSFFPAARLERVDKPAAFKSGKTASKIKIGFMEHIRRNNIVTSQRRRTRIPCTLETNSETRRGIQTTRVYNKTQFLALLFSPQL